MAQQLSSDILYVPKVGIASMSGVSYGYLFFGRYQIIYTPQMSHNLTGYRIMKETSLNVDKYNDLPFWDVIPEMSKELNPDQLEEFAKEMASKIEGSIITPYNAVSKYKIGLLAGFTVKSNENKTRFSVGGKRKEIKAFLEKTGKLN